MNRYLLSAALACLFAFSVQAQSDRGTFSIIPKAGISVSNLRPTDKVYIGDLTDYNQSVHSRYRSGFSAGVELEYQFADMTSASIGAFYTNAGCKYENGEAEIAKNEFNVLHDSYLSMGYLQVPLMVNCYIVRNLAIKTGIQVGYLLTSTWHHELQSYTIDPDTNVRTYGTNNVSDGSASDVLNRLDLTVPLGISYEYERMVFDARYHIGLRKVYKLLDDYKNHLFTLTIGYKFEL